MKRSVAITLVLLLATAVADADVRRQPRLRLAQTSRAPVEAGRESVRTIELTTGESCRLDDIELAGAGWDVALIQPVHALVLSGGESVAITFRGTPADPNEPLVLSYTLDGFRHSRSLDLGPEYFERAQNARPIVRVDGRPVVRPARRDPDPPRNGSVAGGTTLHLVGRFVYFRSDGLMVGADGILFQIMDDDFLIDEVMYEGETDRNGNFDVTFEWDDCGIDGCDDPDIYVYFETDTSVAQVQDDSILETDYHWSTDGDIYEDFTGDFIDFGTMMPQDSNDYPAVHIHSTLTKAHRFVEEADGTDVAQVDVQWPSGSTGAYYNPTFEEIHIAPNEQWNEGTITHEYGHHYLANYSQNLTPDYCNGFCDGSGPVCPGGQCNPLDVFDNGGHCQWCRETNHDAWNEGWPSWLGGALMRTYNAQYGFAALSANDGRYSVETLGTCCQDNQTHAADITEGYVTALLQDIEDPNLIADDHDGPPGLACIQDLLNLGVDEIFTVTRVDQPTNPMDFINKWRQRYPHVDQDFWSTARNVSVLYAFPPPAPVINPPEIACKSAFAGEPVSLTVQANGAGLNYRWRHNGVNLTDGVRISGATSKTLSINPAQVADSGSYDVVVSSCDGTASTILNPPFTLTIFGATLPHGLVSWGLNGSGQLGQGFVSMTPALAGGVVDLPDAIAVDAGQNFSVALRANGTVWAWGYQGSGQLGNPDVPATGTTTPVQVVGLDNVLGISCGSIHALAIKRDGTLWGWGQNSYGGVGDGTWGNARPTPVQANISACVVAVETNDLVTGALTSDGRVWTWGNGQTGQLGDGGGFRPVPAPILGLADVKAIAVSPGHMLALKNDGTVWGWGSNTSGELGNEGVPAQVLFPAPIPGIDDVTAVFAAEGRSFAIRSDGVLWAWGNNGGAQLGDGQTAIRLHPVPTLLTNVKSVAPGDGCCNATLALTNDGRIWAWGSNEWGLLNTPNPPTASLNLPEPLSGVTIATAIGRSNTHALALASVATSPVIDHQPGHQIVLVGGYVNFMVSASGTAPLWYQWFKTGEGPISDDGRVIGSSSPSMAIAPAMISDAGEYTVRVANTQGELFSAPATLVVSERIEDVNGDGVINLDDFAALRDCLAGPGVMPMPADPDVPPAGCLAIFDDDADVDVDLRNFAAFANEFGVE